MKAQKGYSLIVLVITIIILIILVAIVINPSTEVLDDTQKSKEAAEAALDNDKIAQAINYELAGAAELMDIEIDFKRIPLTESLAVKSGDDIYGKDWILYISEHDIEKVERKTGKRNYYKPFKDISKSYLVETQSGEYVQSGEVIRLGRDWNFAP